MKTLKVEAIYPIAFEIFDEITEHFLRFIEEVYNKGRLHSVSAISAHSNSRIDTSGRRAKPPPNLVHPQGRTPIGGHFCPRI